MSGALKEFAPYVFDAAALALFGVAAYCLISGQKWAASRAGVGLLAAAVCALIGNADRLEMIKFSLTGGLEAKTRQLETGLEELRRLGSVLGQIVIEADAARGRLGSAPTAAQHEALRNHVLEVLKSIGLSESQLLEVSASDRKWVIVDYVFVILHFGAQKVSQDQKSEWGKSIPNLNNIENWETLTPTLLIDWRRVTLQGRPFFTALCGGSRLCFCRRPAIRLLSISSIGLRYRSR